jgi:predicted nucleotidyltransferase
MAMMQTNPTPYAEVNELVALLLAQIKSIFGQKLVGLYLYGSLVTGDFDPECSDIDLVAALSSDIDEQECDQLRKMHNDFAQQHRQWDDRIEVVYLSANALQTYRSQISQIAVISPGESLYVPKFCPN